MTWCEICRDHFPIYHFDADGYHFELEWADNLGRALAAAGLLAEAFDFPEPTVSQRTLERASRLVWP